MRVRDLACYSDGISFMRNGNLTRKCEFPGCDQSTRQRKPFCSEHVLEHDYVKRVLAKADELDRKV